MAWISRFAAAVLLALQFAWSGMWRLLWRVVGQPGWQAPSWPAQLWHAAWDRPGRTAGVLALAAAVGASWHAWVHRTLPEAPIQVRLTLEAPGLTRYDRTPIEVAPLRLMFSGSAAPLADVDGAAQGFRLQPELAGVWRWEGESQVRFQPSADWPVGQRFEVVLDRSLAIAPEVDLLAEDLRFSTAAFQVSLGQQEFYQDPQQASLKKGIFAVTFSHPVDPASLESAVSLSLRDGGGKALSAPGFTVNYDEYRLQAWIHSAPLSLPANGGQLNVQLAAGIRSALPLASSDGGRVASLNLPALYSLKVQTLQAVLVDNAQHQPEQALIAEFSFAVRDNVAREALQAWVLPPEHPERPGRRHAWSVGEVTEAILARATPLVLEANPAEREYIEVHSFRFQAAQADQLFVRVQKGVQSFGGYLLGQDVHQVLRVPNYPKLLKFVGDGALLALKGERKVTAVSRNVPGLELELGRILPSQVHHLVNYNHGSYAQPRLYAPNIDALSERFHERVPLTAYSPEHAHYQGLDLAPWLASGKRGIFALTLREWNPDQPEQQLGESDRRLVVLTDIGLIVKRQKDEQRRVYLASLSDGTPIAGARVAVIGANGEPVLSVTSDAQGHARLPQLDGFTRERQPVMILATLGDDAAFLPLQDGSRELDVSRFDVGGEINADTAGTLDAHLFSDRGLYRPGDTMHFGLIVRAADWRTSLAGLPIFVELTDPQGTTVLERPLALGELGFEELAYTTADSAPTGTYTLNLYLRVGASSRRDLGYTTVSVKEFLPDRMKVKASLSTAARPGWIKPDGLVAQVEAMNLFGTPAQERRVTAQLSLQPFWPRFAAWPDHQFFDPRRAEDGFEEALSDGQTDAQGVARFALPLSQYADATYQLRYSAQVYEPGGGRSVAAETQALVSSNDYLLGVKGAGALHWIKRGDPRTLEVLAIDPDLAPVAVADVSAVLIEQRHVSLLTRQRSGAWKYESQLREVTVSTTPVPLPATASGTTFALSTREPGSFRLEFRDGSGRKLHELRYSVAGDANLTRPMARNAELELKLSRGEYAAGDELELSIRAPYTGAGLITIERDAVYAHHWFRADTTSSVQRIRVPEGLEIGAYAHVMFLRDPASEDIHTSPLSHGVVPFAINRGRRTSALRLDAPTRIRPGEPLALRLHAEAGAPARVAVFAVDEGILQVARYTLAHPLDHFMQKRMLEVGTAQILDLLLPEFSRLAALAAPGGDDDGSAGRNLNPFKRKRDRPAVHWFGIQTVNGTLDLNWSPPDTFNGALRVMAVAVERERMGTAQATTQVRGEFVLTPSVPTTVAPGDGFEVSLGVADNRESADAATVPIEIRLEAGEGLQISAAASQSVSSRPGQEHTLRWTLKAQAAVGTPVLRFSARSGGAMVQQQVGLSLRPAVPRSTQLTTGRMPARQLELPPNRTLWPAYTQRRISAARVPAVLMDGLDAYLQDFPHQCTEQIISQVLPAVVYTRHPELAPQAGAAARASRLQAHQHAMEILLSRQNSAGALGLWQASIDEADPFLTNYAVLYLLEAREAGLPVPAQVLERANAWLRQLAVDPATAGAYGLRQRAFAVYLLTRQGEVTTQALLALRQQLDADLPGLWQADTTGVLLAAAYAGLKLEQGLEPLLAPSLTRLGQAAGAQDFSFREWQDPLVADAMTVFLLQRHFPERAGRLPASAVERLLLPVQEGRFHTLSAAVTLLALEAYARNQDPGTPIMIEGVAADGSAQALETSPGLVQRATWDGAVVRLRLAREDTAAVWYARSESGFDQALPEHALSQGIEVQRDYLNAQGQPVSSVTLGEELTVRVRLRSADARSHFNLAIIDLLPGGFEIVEPQPDEDGNLPALVEATQQVQYSDAREDRMLIYTQAGKDLGEYRYRIKATTVGRFQVPPAWAESLYQREVRAHGAADRQLEVAAPP